MTFWSRRTTLIILTALILLSIIFRYPLVEHERYQTDSYSIHHLSDTVVIDGYMKWTLHPLSYIGYYPLSYPAGVPLMLAEFSSMTGLSIECSILILDMVIATLFCLGVFLLVRSFVYKTEFALLATFFAVLAPRYIDTSYWCASARAMAVLLIVLLFVALVKVGYNRDRRLSLVVGLLGFGCVAVHHMAVMVLVFVLAYLVTTVQTSYTARILCFGRRASIATLHIVTAFLILIVPLLLFDFFSNAALRVLGSSDIIDFDSTILTITLAAGVSYTSQIGFVVLFAVAYVPILMRDTRLTVGNLLPFYAIVLFLPMFGEALYVSMIITPFVAIFGALWFSNAHLRSVRKRFITASLVVLLAASIALPVGTTDRWNTRPLVGGDQVVVGDQIFNDANYGYYDQQSGYAICNVYYTKSRLETYSRMDFLASGIASLLNGDVDAVSVRSNITRSSKSFPRNIYNWYDYSQEPNIDYYVRKLLIDGVSVMDSTRGIGMPVDYFATHSRLVVVIDNRWPSHLLTAYTIGPANLPLELQLSRPAQEVASGDESSAFSSYAYYRSNLVTMYLAQLC